MATITTLTELGVTSKYIGLVKVSVCNVSSYIVAKETLEEMYKGIDWDSTGDRINVKTTYVSGSTSVRLAGISINNMVQ